MGQLKFHLQLQSGMPHGWSGVPVEIRKRNLAMVKRCLSSDTVELPSGTYYVSARMPAGQLLSGEVQVQEGQVSTADLRPEDERDESPHEFQAHQHFAVQPRSFKRSEDPASVFASILWDRIRRPRPGTLGLELLKSLPPSPAIKIEARRCTLRMWRLSHLWMDPTPMPLPAGPPARGEGYMELLAGPCLDSCLAQLLQPRTPPINVVLPIQGQQKCRIMVIRTPEGDYDLDARLENAEADLLLRYSYRGEREEALQVERAVQAEAQLQDKQRDPIAAAAGAYALLRFGELERLHDWTRNLYLWFESLPDGATIYGEHAARQGEHRAALEAFLALEERGLPIFSDGLSFAVRRLRSYLKYARNPRARGPSLGSVDSARLVSLLKKLLRYANRADFRKPLTTFTGAVPADPRRRRAQPPSGPSMDLSPYVG